MIRLLLVIDNTAFIWSVVCALKVSYTINDLLKSNSFWVFFCIWFPYLIKPDKHQGLIHPCFFLCNNNKTLRCFYIFDSLTSFTSKYYHWWQYKSICCNSKDNSHVSLFRTRSSNCHWLLTFLHQWFFWHHIKKYWGFVHITYQGKRIISYLLKSGAFRIKWWYFTFKLGWEFLTQSCFFHRAKLFLSLNWQTQPLLASKQGLCGNINDFAFFCNANMDTGKWRSFIISNQLNNSSSMEAGYDSGSPAPLVFHTFPPLKPWCLSLFSGSAALQILRIVESWSWNALVLSR